MGLGLYASSNTGSNDVFVARVLFLVVWKDCCLDGLAVFLGKAYGMHCSAVERTLCHNDFLRKGRLQTVPSN